MLNKKQILQDLQSRDNFLLTSHINPDGDSLGSMLGLALALRKMGKKVTMVNSDPTPEVYKFLPNIDEVMAVEEVYSNFSTAIVLDCSDWKRMGKSADLIKRCEKILNIDHHITNESFGSINYIVGDAAATGEMVYILLLELGLAVDSEIATALYTALMTDTGGFRHSNTTSACFRMAAELTEKGANPHRIAEKVYSTFSFNSLQLLGKALTNIECSSCGKISWLVINQETLLETGSTMEETEGLITYLIGMEGVEVAVLFKELEENKVKISFRARWQVDVSKIAGAFGGGGHAKAAGCFLEEKINIAKARVLQEINKAL